MKTIEEYEDLIESSWDTPAKAEQVTAEAVKDYPESAMFWRFYAYAIVKVDCERHQEALSAYTKSIAIERNAEILEDLGYYFDVYEDNFAVATVLLKEAWEIEESLHVAYGLFRCAAQMGNAEDAEHWRDMMISYWPEDELTRQAIREMDDGIWSR